MSAFASYPSGDKWGVHVPGGQEIYDPIFTEDVANRIAEIYCEDPALSGDWQATHNILRADGFSDQDLFPK